MFRVWALSAAWLGCNAILGNESAIFDPSAADGGGSGDGSTADRATSDAMLDAGDEGDADASPSCVGIDFDASPTNCGACGHDCRGGDCQAGHCQPIVLANDVKGPGAIAVDATHVYWINATEGNVYSVPIDGGAKTLLFAPPDSGAPVGGGDAIAFFGGNVYFGWGDADAGIVRCATPTCDGGATLERANVDVPVSLAITPGGLLYWTETVPNAGIHRCQLPCTGGVDDVVPATQGFPDHLSVLGNDVYWTTITPSARLETTDQVNAPRKLADGFIEAVHAASGEVYFQEDGMGPSAVPVDGGAVRRLRTVATHGHYLALADGGVFATESDKDFVYACPFAGCGDAGAVLATDQATPMGITHDATFIYWANEGTAGAGGTIMRLAK